MDGCGGVVVWTGWTSGRVFSRRNISRDFVFEFSWTSGRVFLEMILVILYANLRGPVEDIFLEEIFLGIFDANFPGPEVDFFLEEIFLGIFDANFPGPVVEFSLEEIFLLIFYSNFPGPMVEFFLEEIFLGIFFFEFSWTSGRLFSWRNILRMRIFAPKMLRNISPTDAVWTGCCGVDGVDRWKSFFLKKYF